MLYKYALSFIILLLCCSFSGRCSEEARASNLIIKNIEIKGNRKTREKVILRELRFKAGDTIPAAVIMDEIEFSRLNVFNLGLFKDVKMNISEWEEDSLTVTIDLIERWYYIPAPIFKLTDRNFNVWWVDYDHDFSRTIYGLFYSQDNVTGNNDLLRLGFYTGFSQAVSVMYNFPHINKKQTLGIEAFFRFDRNKSFEYIANGNKHVFYTSNEFVRKIFHTGAVLRYRKEVHDEQYFGLFFRSTSLNDNILELDSNNYFLNDDLRQNFFQFNYRFERDYRNIQAYPTKGYQWSIEVEKLGLGIYNDVDFFNIYGSVSKFIDIGKNFYGSGLIRTKISAPALQPYYNQRGLGYDQDFVRGYEFFVIDGQQYVFTRANIKHNFLNFNMRNPLMKDVRIGSIPFQFFIKGFVDLGYVSDETYFKNNPLNNSLLIGGGLGLDIVTLYNNVFRIEYSLSKANGLDGKKVENGLYLHFVLDISDDMRTLKRARYLDPK
ncbi:MAG: hypothetical protein HKN92_12590 [Chitinophagales bacterium]|nr:hypothetical protein [Chitinophagales bacterium]